MLLKTFMHSCYRDRFPVCMEGALHLINRHKWPEGRPLQQQLKCDHAQRPCIHRCLRCGGSLSPLKSSGRLRSSIRRRAACHACCAIDSGHKGKVDEHPVVRAGLPHDVAGLKVAVYVTCVVQFCNPLADVAQYLHCARFKIRCRKYSNSNSNSNKICVQKRKLP